MARGLPVVGRLGETPAADTAALQKAIQRQRDQENLTSHFATTSRKFVRPLSPTFLKSDTTSECTAESRPFQFTGRIRSFQHAMIGILRMVRCQHNAWIHATATAIVIVAGFFLHLSTADWCWIIVAISIVWTAEALNTAFEFLADATSPDFHPLVRDAKDVAAAAVLITAVAAVIIG